MTTDSAPTPEGESSIPDEVWEQFLSDNERDIRASAPKEPSARARIVARRLREQEARAAAAPGGKRRRGRRGGAAVPASRIPDDTSWRTGRTDESDRRRLRRGRLRGMVAVVLLVVILLIVLSPSHAWSLVTGKG
ncbi:hypothetical protein OG896_03880 [Streptomyces sp. NBC_00669]|uniref:hypothetical protein n=1 Tax=unclassified Streptomyces TaxID=2593676 RepID=UPI002E2F1C10|nr:hypothetical protein [Streptomyces sp. NBC_00669]